MTLKQIQTADSCAFLGLQYAGFDPEESPEVEHIQFEVRAPRHCSSA